MTLMRETPYIHFANLFTIHSKISFAINNKEIKFNFRSFEGDFRNYHVWFYCEFCVGKGRWKQNVYLVPSSWKIVKPRYIFSSFFTQNLMNNAHKNPKIFLPVLFSFGNEQKKCAYHNISLSERQALMYQIRYYTYVHIYV